MTTQTNGERIISVPEALEAGNVYRNLEGKEMTTLETITEAYRDKVNEGKKESELCVLPDTVIWNIIANIPGDDDDDDVDIARCEALEDAMTSYVPAPAKEGDKPKAEKKPLSDEEKKELAKIGQSHLSFALGFVRVMDSNETFTKDVKEYLVAKDVAKRGALVILKDLQSIFDRDTMLSWPKPGTKMEDVKGTNQRSDQYETIISGEKVRGSFYSDLFLESKIGKPLAAQFRWAGQAKGKEGVEAEAPEEFRKMEKPQAKRLHELYRGRINNGKALFRKAAQIFWKMEEIRDNVPNAEFDWSMIKDEQGNDVPNAIQVYDKDNPRNVWSDFNISTFLRMNGEAAAKANGTVQDLFATATRTKKKKAVKEGEATSENVPSIKSTKIFEAVSSEFYHYLENEENKARILSILNRKGKDGKYTEEAVLLLDSLMNVKGELNTLLEPFILRYQNWQIEQANKEQAEIRSNRKTG